MRQDLAAEFLADLSSDRCLGTFARLQFSTGKLPLEGQVFAWRALRDEHPSVPLKDDSNDGDGWSGGRFVDLKFLD